MMSEAPAFGKQPPAAYSDEEDGDVAVLSQGPSLRQSFADEYDGFSNDSAADNTLDEEAASAPPPPSLWEQAPATAPLAYAPPPQIEAPQAAPKPIVARAPWEEDDEYEIETPQPQYYAPQPVQEAVYAAPSEPAMPAVGAYIPEPLPVEDDDDAEDMYGLGAPVFDTLETPAPVAVAAAAPAVDEAESEAQAIVAQHHLWLQSGGKEGRRASFRGDRFRGVDFSGMFLPEASFRGASLQGCSFRSATLERADFAEALLSSADFTQAALTGANFQRAQLGTADFTSAIAPEADFSQAEAVGATFHGARLEWASLREAQCGEADFRHANLAKANLRGASLFRARLEEADLTQADLRDANCDHAVFAGASMAQANFKLASLQGVNMQSADFSQALDVPFEAKVDAVAKEREWLQQEAQRLEVLKMELLGKERELENERERLLSSPAASRPASQHTRYLAPDEAELGGFLKQQSKRFLKMGVAWLVVVLVVVAVMLNVIAEMDSSELSFLELLIMGIMLIAPLGLSLAAVVQTMNLSSRLLGGHHETEEHE